MQLLGLAPIVTCKLTSREKQAQHSLVTTVGLGKHTDSCAVLDIDFSCLFGHRFTAVLLKGQLRQTL